MTKRAGRVESLDGSPRSPTVDRESPPDSRVRCSAHRAEITETAAPPVPRAPFDARATPAPNAPLVVEPKKLHARLYVWGKAMLANMDRSRTFGLAAEMSFWLFLSLIPLAAVLGMIAAKLATHDQTLLTPVFDAIPRDSRKLLVGELTRVSAWNGGAVAPIAAIIFIWLAASGVHSIFDALEVATESTARPWWKKRVLAIGSCLALSIGVALLMVLGTGVDWLERIVRHAPVASTVHSSFSIFLRLLLGGLVAFGLVLGLYWVGLPPKARKRMPIAIGAVFAVGLQGILGFGYGFYISKVGDGGAYQAGLSVIGVTMMALYLFSVALLVGVEINHIVGARRGLHRSVHPQIAPPPAVTPDMVGCDGSVAKAPMSAVDRIRESIRSISSRDRISHDRA